MHFRKIPILPNMFPMGWNHQLDNKHIEKKQTVKLKTNTIYK